MSFGNEYAYQPLVQLKPPPGQTACTFALYTAYSWDPFDYDSAGLHRALASIIPAGSSFDCLNARCIGERPAVSVALARAAWERQRRGWAWGVRQDRESRGRPLVLEAFVYARPEGIALVAEGGAVKILAIGIEGRKGKIRRADGGLVGPLLSQRLEAVVQEDGLVEGKEVMIGMKRSRATMEGVKVDETPANAPVRTGQAQHVDGSEAEAHEKEGSPGKSATSKDERTGGLQLDVVMIDS